jgi:hypothetical protein
MAQPPLFAAAMRERAAVAAKGGADSGKGAMLLTLISHKTKVSLPDASRGPNKKSQSQMIGNGHASFNFGMHGNFSRGDD